MSGLTQYKDFLSDAQSSLDYWCEVTKVEFATELGRWMKEQDVSRAQLARLADVSPAYITKALGGNVNFTIETMTKLAMALGGALHIHISQQAAVTHWLDDVTLTGVQALVFRPDHLQDVDTHLPEQPKPQNLQASWS